MVLKIPGYNFNNLFPMDNRYRELFEHSIKLAEGLGGENPDIYEGVMHAKAITSVVEHADISTTYEDLDDMSYTFKINKPGKALINFNAKWYPESDTADFGMRCKIVIDGTDVTASERFNEITAYAETDTDDVLYDGTGSMTINTVAIENLSEGEHTIKIQVRGTSGNANNVGDRRLDIMIWAAPEQI